MNNSLSIELRNNLNIIQDRIKKASERTGRDPKEIQLVAVTKKKNALVIKELYEAGVYLIGESYVQEAAFKIDLLKDLDIEWHMIGPIQSGKEKVIAQRFAVVHSLDRLEIARKLNKEAEKYGRIVPVYLEFNTSGEASKHGWEAADRTKWPEILDDVKEILGMDALKILGLMTMAPYSSDPELSRPYFRLLRGFRDEINNTFPESNINGLSMGMSGDYEVAVEEGATILRIGSALVGLR